MKKILILTDFSENAACAAEAGLHLSGKLPADLLLFNTYIDYATLPYESGGAWDCTGVSRRRQHSIQGLESITEGLESLAEGFDPAARRPAIHFQSANCDLGLGVAQLLEEHQIELVVMGARAQLPDDPLPGADTGGVIKNSSRPVLVVPANTDLKEVRRILFATNFDEHDLSAIGYLLHLSRSLGWQLEVIHVDQPWHTDKTARELHFKKGLEELGAPVVGYRTVADDDPVARLGELLAEDGSAILALLHHHYSFFYRLFHRSKTKAALAKLRAPLLIFPEQIANTESL